jgi:hypothetical protein
MKDEKFGGTKYFFERLKSELSIVESLKEIEEKFRDQGI